MKKIILTILSIIIMTSLISAAEISGTLFSHEGLCNKSCQKIKLIESRQTVYTDHQEKFTFRNVKPGRYTLIVYTDSKPEICEHILLKKGQKSCYSCFDIHGTGVKAQRYKNIKI
ncbi:MAG: hypothetical protein KA886_03525 [Candidatus Cloacimonetes bacterium]|nr:hypothetical protein [Candidatus Cloacimonadota bacterium]